MLNERLAATQMVAEKLFALETAIDEALVCAANLTCATSTARRDIRASTIVGQDAVAKTGETIAALYAAQNAVIDAHGGFAEVRQKMRIPAKAGGDKWKDQPSGQSLSETHLRIA
ncbi:MAG: hypothetical protein V3V15_01815 [Sphingorhabdus sp.]